MSDTVVVPNNDPAAIESGNSWNGLDTAGAPVVVTFSFPTSLPAYDETIGGFTAATDASFTPFTAAEQTQALAALGQWAAASGIVFVEVAPGEGDITFGNVSFSTTTTGSVNGDYQSAGGIGFYPFGDWSYLTGSTSAGYGFTSDLGTGGDVYMNSDYLSSNGTVDLGTLLHEIGHAIGMKHPDQVVYTADGVDHNQVLDPSENSADYTIMSETGDADNETNATLFQLDKLAAADLYGPAGTGGVETGSASGSNSVSSWSWNATTETLTQAAVSATETIYGTSVNDIIYGYDYGGSAPTSGTIALFGLDGTNILYAGSGTTALYGGPDTNTLVGGAGNDSFYVYSNQTTVRDAYTTGNNTIYASGVNFTLPNNVDTLYLYGLGLAGTGNNQNDSIFGDGVYSNTLIAGSGNDYMVGGSGGNTLVAGTGIDTMYGGTGTNIFAFGPGDAPINNPNGTDYIGDFKPGTDKLDFSLFTRAGHQLTFVGTAPLTGPGQIDYFTSGGNTYVEGDVTNKAGADFEIELNGSLTLQATNFVLSQLAAWTGPSAKNRSGTWNTAGDWNTGAVPDAVAQATIAAAGTYTVTSNQNNTIGNLLLNNASATLAIAAGTFTIAGLGTDTNAGTIAVADAAALQVTGTFTNNGTVSLNGTSDTTSLDIAGSATLKGTGKVTLSDSANNAILSNAATATLTNLSTVAGSGTIGDANLTLTNGSTGVIDATGTAAALTIASAGTFKNQGLLEASGSAGLIIDATLINTGSVTVADGSALQVTGSLTNNGTIALNATGGPTSLVIAGSVTLNGMGKVTLTDAAVNAIVSNGAAATLTNQSTITGSGTIGDANLTLTNGSKGIIDATGTTAALTITSAGTFKNQGTVESTGSAGLTINGAVLNTGTLVASAGDLTVTGNVTGAGKETIAANATLTFDAHVAATQKVTFTGSTGTLALAIGQGFAGTVAGLTNSDAIDLENFAYSATKLSMTFGGSDAQGSDTLVTIKDVSLTATIALFNQTAGEFGMSASDYTLSSDQHSGKAGTLFQLAAHTG